MTQSLHEWQDMAAHVTYFFRWEPHVAWGMTYTKLQFWLGQAQKIKQNYG